MTRRLLFEDPLEGRDRLAYLYEYFTLLYDTKSADQAWLREFWSWFVGLEEQQVNAYNRQAWARIMAVGADWDIAQLRKDLRADIEAHLGPLIPGVGVALETKPESTEAVPPGAREEALPYLPEVPRRLILRRGRSGRLFLAVGLRLEQNADVEASRKLSLAEVAHELDGLARDALGRCPHCGHLFMRRRAKTRQYCSLRCVENASVVREKTAREKQHSATRAKPSKGRKR